jgi:D-isomer specific 2-hydroxyacid dehydrogenase, catalytic domain
MKSKSATKETGGRISCTTTAMRANTHETLITNFTRSITNAKARQCHLCGSCVKCHLCCHAIARNEPRPDVDEAWFVTVNFMARQLHALVTRTPKYRIAREVALHTVKGFTLSFATIKIIATYSVGFEHIDLEAAARRKLPVAYTPGVNSEATADIAMLLLLGASRRAYEAHAGPGQCGGGAER